MDWILIWFVLTTGDIEVVQVEFETEKLCDVALQEMQKKRRLFEKNSNGYCVQVRQNAENREIELPQ